MVNEVPARSGEDWLQTPLGGYLLERLGCHLDAVVADLFGYHAVQVGLPQADLLRASRMTLRVRVAPEAPAELRARPDALPIASQVVDLVVLPHVLEFSERPHAILREVERILMPEGRLVVAGINPWSLWGIRRGTAAADAPLPWRGEFISLPRLKDWLTLLGFEVTGGRMACYAPPFAQTRWLDRFGFMEAAGNRWWPFAGGVYVLEAVKRVQGMRIILPRWSERAAPRRALAAVPRRVSEPQAAREGLPRGSLRLVHGDAGARVREGR
jgi:SAM-dependent methyltransferase